MDWKPFRKIARECVIFMLVGVASSLIIVPFECVRSQPIARCIFEAIIFSLYGFVAGFGVWVLYRLVWFAVKG